MAGYQSRRPMLPGGDWVTADEARTWLDQEREGLGWSDNDIEREFNRAAGDSDLYIGPGGGALFERPTPSRVGRFAAGGDHIPDRLFWIPLAIARAAARPSIPEPFAMFDWDREHIPEHRSIREDEWSSRLS